MSQVDVTAAAWVVANFGLKVSPDREQFFMRWRIRAEVSVADADGQTVDGLAKRAWDVHVTDALGASTAPAFTVARADASGQVIPGFYVLKIPDAITPLWVIPTALGVVVDTGRGGSKLDLHGQVVVPIRHEGPTVVPALTQVPI